MIDCPYSRIFKAIARQQDFKLWAQQLHQPDDVASDDVAAKTVLAGFSIDAGNKRLNLPGDSFKSAHPDEPLDVDAWYARQKIRKAEYRLAMIKAGLWRGK